MSGGKRAALPPRAYPCVRFAPRPLSLCERGVLSPCSAPGIPCELRFACSRPLTLREGDGLGFPVVGVRVYDAMNF